MESVPSSVRSLDDYARRLTRCTLIRLAGPVAVLGVLFAAAAARSGWRQALLVVSVLFAVDAIVIGTVITMGRVREQRRRRRGADPSWAALASGSVARGFHSHGDIDSRDLGEIRGRLSRTPLGWEWVARGRRTGAPVRRNWPIDAIVETRRMLGLGRHGLVRFTDATGTDAILTVWRIDDLERTTATAPPAAQLP